MADTGDSGRISSAVALALVLVVGAVVGGVAFAQSTDGPSGEEILENAHEQYRSAETLTGSADITVSNASDERSSTVEYALARSDGARMAVTHNGTTMTAGTNGTVAWVDSPVLQRAWNVENASASNTNSLAETCEVTRNRADVFAANHTASGEVNASAVATNVSSIDCESLAGEWTDAKQLAPKSFSKSNLTATRTGTETLGGTEAYVVAIKHENESIDTEGTMWVATDDYRVLKGHVTDGTNATTVRYHDQRFNVSIHESTFAPPTERSETATTTYESFGAAQENADTDLPTLAADGFEFEGATVTQTGDGQTIAQQYANDSTNITLLTTDSGGVPTERLNGTAVDVDGQAATAATVSGQTVVVWTENGTTHAVVTDRSTEETVALAESVAE